VTVDRAEPTRDRDEHPGSRARLLEVARELLEERPWREIAVAEITEAAQLSRTALYRHFDDRRALLLALVAEIGSELERADEAWVSAGDRPAEGLAQALRRLTGIHVEHGRLLQAIVDASADDDQLREVYLGLAQRFADRAAAQIERDVAAGLSHVQRPREVARALVWMNERYLQASFGRAPLGDPEEAAQTLAEVWVRTVYDGRSV
jgi:AcrR family transcriptional regulator